MKIVNKISSSVDREYNLCDESVEQTNKKGPINAVRLHGLEMLN